MNIPTPATLAIWDKGEAISDTDLAEIEAFFGAMVRGCEALGARYLIATMALRVEHDRATRIQTYRSSR